MTYSIAGKTALVTGANRGIGKALVEALIKAGAKRIYAAGRSLENLAEVVQLAPDVVEAVQLDVTSLVDIKQLDGRLTQLDLLINNAGTANGSYFSGEEALAVASAEMATNYFGPVHLTHALMPLLRHSKGAVINVSSIAGLSNFPLLGPYSASKAAVHSFTQGLRAELRSAGVAVMGVYPGPVDTRMSAGSEAAKESPTVVAEAILSGLAEGSEDVFPDPFSQAMYQLFRQNPKQLEQQFALAVG